MALKRSSDLDELCYPFIYQQDHLCDYEVVTDELCSHVGYILAALDERFDDLADDLKKLQPMIYHLNGSIRGRLAVSEEDLGWVKLRYQHYQTLVKNQVSGFVLPRGDDAAMRCHLSRSCAKKAIRQMVRIDQEGRAIPDVLHRFCNLLCNFFFILAVVINDRNGFEETVFTSQSYGNIF